MQFQRFCFLVIRSKELLDIFQLKTAEEFHFIELRQRLSAGFDQGSGGGLKNTFLCGK